jgi:hypothetical protein
MRSCPERSRTLPIVPSPLPTWSEIPPRQRDRLVAVVCQMVLVHLLRQGAALEASDEHAA